jgi:hypothetical protein
MQDLYETLGAHPRADADAIVAAYQRLRALYDPGKLEGAADCSLSNTGSGCCTTNSSRGTFGVVSIATLNVLIPGLVIVVKSLTLALLSSTTETVILMSAVGFSGSGGPRYWCAIPNEPVVL